MTAPSLARRMLLVGGVASFLSVRPGEAASLVATPPQSEGPFYPTSLPADLDNDLVQVRGQAAQAMGMVLHLEGRVLDASGQPLPGARVEIWQCDAQGLYDHPGQRGRERRDQAFQGYGQIRADVDGRYRFRTLKPVAYPGRTPHIHLKAATEAGRQLTSQFYITGEPQNERDFLFRQFARNVAQRERVEMRLVPAPGVETGAFATTMDIVIG